MTSLFLCVAAVLQPPEAAAARVSMPHSEAERTFVDLWIRGVDTSGLMVGNPATFAEVFTVSGDQAFDTDCGKRVLPRLEPIEVERYRSAPAQRPEE
jgi:hypothetical protein